MSFVYTYTPPENNLKGTSVFHSLVQRSIDGKVEYFARNATPDRLCEWNSTLMYSMDKKFMEHVGYTPSPDSPHKFEGKGIWRSFSIKPHEHCALGIPSPLQVRTALASNSVIAINAVLDVEEGPEVIEAMRGEYRCLSNFYNTPVRLGGVMFRSPEAAFQAAKSKHPAYREKLSRMTPRQARTAGRKVELIKHWDWLRYDVMDAILGQRYRREPELRALAASPNDRLVMEGNTWNDVVWGAEKGFFFWEGQNMLGYLHMVHMLNYLDK